MSDEQEVKFLRDADADGVNLADDPRIALIAVCVVSQQAAGFRDGDGNAVVDLREVKCQECGAPGFNSGWGFWRFRCGAEIMTDGEPAEECPKAEDTRS